MLTYALLPRQLLQLLVYEALRGLKLLVYEAFRYKCMRH
jgi:hypothetical protein